MQQQAHPDAMPEDRPPRIRVLAMPADTNPLGKIFGGWIMSQMDVAGSIAAVERIGGPVATVAVDSMEFHKPVYVGDLISCFAEVSRVGRTSIRTDVQVYAQRVHSDGSQTIKVTEATIVYVALNADGSKRQITHEV